ncbi:hypothetical protein ACOMHN_066819 [Nucella lapillus]
MNNVKQRSRSLPSPTLDGLSVTRGGKAVLVKRSPHTLRRLPDLKRGFEQTAVKRDLYENNSVRMQQSVFCVNLLCVLWRLTEDDLQLAAVYPWTTDQ